jgi:anti-sigma-K factor RskA/putative zinc finger protein
MSTDLRHREIEDLLAAYALDAVDTTEAAMVAAHLEGCPLCRAELDGYLETAAALGTTAAAEHVDAPPAGLWDRIAGSLAESVPEEGAGPAGRPAFLRQVTAGDAGPSDEGTVVGPTEPAAAPIDLSARRRRTYRWAAATVGVAAAVAIAVLGVNLSQTNNQLDQARAALAAAGPGAAASALRQPGHQVVRMDSPSGAQLAEFVLTPDQHGYLVSSSMADLPSGETYQLWAMFRGRPISLGLMGSRPHQVAFTVAGSVTPTALAITVEPAGGTVAPTQTPLASGAVAS